MYAKKHMTWQSRL